MIEPIMIGIIAGLAVVFVWVVVLTVVYIKSQKTFKKITKGISKKDLKTLLKEIADSLKNAGNEIKAIQQDLDTVEEEMKSHLQKIGFIRFNPFSDTGGNQSFSLCLLDDNNDGIVITSLHSRDSTRIYSKKIKKGSTNERELSKEEQEALKQALKNKK
ncbi:DUF4446 family protein [Patescibacteria group bacterium]